MKNYIRMMIITSVFCGSYFHLGKLSAVQQNLVPQYIPIVSTTGGSDSLVDAIKQYSDITESDVNKWNFLWLGSLDVVPALAIGGYSMTKSGAVAGRLFENRPTAWLPTPPAILNSAEPWMAAAALGAGLLSYKILYPRIRRGMLDKVQKFIDACGRIAMAQQQVVQVPVEWSLEQPIAICKALNNLEYQAMLAGILLNKIGRNDPDVAIIVPTLTGYANNLINNKQRFAFHCNPLIQAEETERMRQVHQRGQNAYVAGLEIKNSRNLLNIAKDGLNFAKDVVQTGKDMYNWTKSNIVPLGLSAAVAYYWSGNR